MTTVSRTFSESWHRVADLRLALRPTVSVRKQAFRGETWYLIEDPFNNSFFRVRPEAYQFLSRLRADRSVEEIWEQCLARFPDTAPGQDEAIQLLAQLHHLNLLYYTGSADTAKIFDRYERRRQRELKANLINILFPRFHVYDPDDLLNACDRAMRHLVGYGGLALWLALVLMGTKQVLDHAGVARQQAEGVLAPGNWLLLYLAIVMVKTIHEMGHAVLCKRFGGEVHSMGLTLLILTPLPYVDATSAWGLRSRWERALVGAGGMIAELLVASVAAATWAHTGAGTIHSIAYNILWIASVSTLVFNVNPLVRLDGYYILADVLDLPNLGSRSTDQLAYLAERHLFGRPEAESPASTASEAAWLTVFAILSGAYRFLIFAGILMFLADKFLILGLVLAAVCAVTWIGRPLWNLGEYLISSPRLRRCRKRAAAVTVGGLAALVLVLGVLPFPRRFRAPGIVEARRQVDVATETPGYVERVLVPSGTVVTTGTPLVTLVNREMDLEIEETTAALAEIEAAGQKVETWSSPDVEPVQRRVAVVAARLAALKTQQEALTVKARQDGTWVSPSLAENLGKWLPRGTMLGKIVDTSGYRLTAVILQDEASNLFQNQIRSAGVRLRGLAGMDIPVTDFRIIPYQQRRLPSAALGWRGGGEIPVSMADSSGVQSIEPFFEMHAVLPPMPGLTYLQGHSGVLRLSMDPEPLLWQWGREIRQLIQERYHT